MKHNKYIISVLQIQNITNFFFSLTKAIINHGHHKLLLFKNTNNLTIASS